MRRTISLTYCALLASVALPVTTATCVTAGTLVGTGGFEDRLSGPGFTTMALEGQNGWVATSEAGSTATIAAMSGGQGLQLEHNSADRRWAVFPSSSHTPVGRYVTISWDMLVTVTNEPDVLGPFFGVEAYAANGGYTLLGSLGVDATSGELLIQQASTGFLVAPGPSVTSGSWNNFVIELDYLEDNCSTYLNGNLVATTGFVDDDKTELDTFSDADISTFSVASSGGTGQMGTDYAWIDNFLVVDGILGDYNHDDVVNAVDYTVWRNTLGATGLTPAADGDGDGIVGAGDYLVWKQNFGRSNALSGDQASESQVPEPPAWGLAGLMILGGLISYRHGYPDGRLRSIN